MEEPKLKPLQLLYFYILWFVSGVLTILDGFMLRQAITAIAAVLGNAVPMEWQVEHNWYIRWTVRAVDPVAIALLTLVALLVIIFLDYFYRAAIAKNRFKRTFAMVTGIQIGLAGISAVAIWIVAKVIGS